MNQIVETFQEITGFNLKSFIQRLSSFFLSDTLIIQNYYTGKIKSLPIRVIENLKQLKKDYHYFEEILADYKNQFNTVEYWELIEVVDYLGLKLTTVENYWKFLKSSLQNGQYSLGLYSNTVIKENQDLETIALETNEKWEDIALRNLLIEEDYTKEGGNKISIANANNVFFVNIKSIIDSPIGERIYGKDISNKISFNDNDIVTLEYKKTLKQTFNNLLGLRKGDIPENPNLGIEEDLFVGNSVEGFLYPVLFRQLNETFSSDDSFKSVLIKKIELVEDSIRIQIDAITRLDEIETGTIN